MDKQSPSKTPSTKETYSGIVSKIKELFRSNTIYVYVYVDERSRSRHYKISLIDRFFEIPISDRSESTWIDMWGSEQMSYYNNLNSKECCINAALFFCMGVTMAGYEVYLNNKAFDPLEPLLDIEEI